MVAGKVAIPETQAAAEYPWRCRAKSPCVSDNAYMSPTLDTAKRVMSWREISYSEPKAMRVTHWPETAIKKRKHAQTRLRNQGVSLVHV